MWVYCFYRITRIWIKNSTFTNIKPIKKAPPIAWIGLIFTTMIKMTTNTAAVYNANIGKYKRKKDLSFDFSAMEDISQDQSLDPGKDLTKANKELEKSFTEGKSYIGIGALRRLKSATNVLFRTAAHQKRPVNLLTLTLPSEYSKKTGENINTIEGDKYLKRMLIPPIIDYLKTNWKMHLYIYRCETQDKGRLHFHLLIDAFVNKEAINKAWNKICSYYLTNVDINAPSTRIDGIKDETSMSSYVAKYLTKGAPEGRRNTGGRQWGCCEDLKESKLYTISDTDTTLHAKTIYYLEELYLSYPEQCDKFFICKNGEIKKIEPVNQQEIICISYRFNSVLYSKFMPKDVIFAESEYYLNYSRKLYQSINEKSGTYRFSRISRLAFDKSESRKELC